MCATKDYALKGRRGNQIIHKGHVQIREMHDKCVQNKDKVL